MAKKARPDGAVEGFYMAANGPKRTWLVPPVDETKAWLLEFFHPKHKQWVFLDGGRGRPVGPWSERRALDEMVQWMKGATHCDEEGARLMWRIRNIKSGEITLDAIVAP